MADQNNVIGEVRLTDKFTDTLDNLNNHLSKLVANVSRLNAASQTPAGLEKELKVLDKIADSIEKVAKKYDAAAESKDKYLNTKAQVGTGGELGAPGRISAPLSNVTRFLGIGVGAFAARQVLDYTLDTAKIGASYLDVENSFQRLTTSYQVNGRAIVAALREASHGSLENVDSMAYVNRALFAQNKDLARDLPKIYETARAAAAKSGEDATHIMDSLITGILRGSYRLIDNADIYLSVSEAVDQYAESIGKSTDALTLQERQSAIQNAIIDQSHGIVQAAITDQATYTEKINSVTAALANLKAAVGERIVIEIQERGDVNKAVEDINRLADTVSRNARIDELTEKNFSRIQRESPNFKDDFTYQFAGDLINNFTLGLIDRRAAWGGFSEAMKKATEQAEQQYAAEQALAASGVNLITGYNQLSAGVFQFATEQKSAEDSTANITGMFSNATGEITPYEQKLIDLTNSFHDLNDELSLTERLSAGASSLKSIASSLLNLQGYISDEEIASMYGDYQKRVEDVSRNHTGGGIYLDLELRAIENEPKDLLSNFKEQERELEKNSTSAASAVKNLASEIRSVLLTNVDPDKLDFLKTEAGTYENAPLEPVRQLFAIAERGFQELEDHPDWAELLAIPPEVLGGTEAGLKAWALEAAELGKNLGDLSRVDMDAFLREWDNAQNLKIGQQNLLNALKDELIKTGRKQAGDPSLDAELSSMLGFANPEAQGKSIAGSVATGIQNYDLSGALLDSWDAAFKSDIEGYQKLGKAIGKVVGEEVSGAIISNLSGSRSRFIDSLMPGIISRLKEPAKEQP